MQNLSIEDIKHTPISFCQQVIMKTFRNTFLCRTRVNTIILFFFDMIFENMDFFGGKGFLTEQASFYRYLGMDFLKPESVIKTIWQIRVKRGCCSTQSTHKYGLMKETWQNIYFIGQLSFSA